MTAGQIRATRLVGGFAARRVINPRLGRSQYCVDNDTVADIADDRGADRVADLAAVIQDDTHVSGPDDAALIGHRAGGIIDNHAIVGAAGDGGADPIADHAAGIQVDTSPPVPTMLPWFVMVALPPSIEMPMLPPEIRPVLSMQPLPRSQMPRPDDD